MKKNDVSVSLAINGNLLKEKVINSIPTFHLLDDTEFALVIDNMSRTKYAVDVIIDGKNQSHRLILREGEHVNLERWFEDNRKFKFVTYDALKNNPGIANNGNITLKFYKEQSSQPVITHTRWTPYYYDNTDRTIYPSAWPSTSTFVSCASTATVNSSIQLVNNALSSDTIKTGKTEMGNISNQEFNTDYFSTFEYFPSFEINMKLLPAEVAHYEYKTTNDTRVYCSECGRKIKNGWKYCAGCGKKV